MKRMMGQELVSRLLKGVIAVAVMALVGALPAQAETTFERVKREKLVTFGFANEPPYTIAALESVTGQDPEVLQGDHEGVWRRAL